MHGVGAAADAYSGFSSSVSHQLNGRSIALAQSVGDPVSGCRYLIEVVEDDGTACASYQRELCRTPRVKRLHGFTRSRGYSKAW